MNLGSVSKKKFVSVLKDLGFFKEVGKPNLKKRRRGGSHQFWKNKDGVIIKPKVCDKEITKYQIEIVGRHLEVLKIIGRREFVHRVMR